MLTSSRKNIVSVIIANFFGAKLVKFGQIWLCLGKIKPKFDKNEAKFWQK